MQSKERCEFCQTEFGTRAVRKKIRGQPHTFCCEGCYVLWRYKRPACDREVFYQKFTIRAEAPDLDQLMSE